MVAERSIHNRKYCMTLEELKKLIADDEGEMMKDRA